jgi:type IV secretory pathway VirB3-like protein
MVIVSPIVTLPASVSGIDVEFKVKVVEGLAMVTAAVDEFVYFLISVPLGAE